MSWHLCQPKRSFDADPPLAIGDVVTLAVEELGSRVQSHPVRCAVFERRPQRNIEDGQQRVRITTQRL
ncbi:hypothetical protein [Mycobacterium sp. MUNTM1]